MKIFAIVLIILGIIAVVGFSIAFFAEIFKTNKEEKEEQPENVSNEEVKEEQQEDNNAVQDEFDLDSMLARLEANAIANNQEAAEEEAKEEVVEEQPKEVEEVKEEVVEETPAEEVKEEAEVTDAKEEKAGSTKVIVVTEKTEEVINNNVQPEEVKEQEVVDLSTRLASVKEAQEKVDADLTKASRDVNRYERTERRMARNQKLLDKKADDLTKLNLVLYSVTDIKNIDQEKKQKQEELTVHINDLKSSIRDAENYLETNKEKYENSKKMQAFFEGEKARLDADEQEILTLMGKNKKDSDEE
ncbi:MAG: hypothetical protein J5689_01580 [Clostridia bacterium]|nr:hypothetical protein [Clostridia bacterium]